MARRGPTARRPAVSAGTSDPHSLAAHLAAFLEYLLVKAYSPETVAKTKLAIASFIRWCSERGIARMRVIARTGCGIVTNQGAYPDPLGEGKAYFRQLAIFDDKFLPQFERIAADIKAQGAMPIQQVGLRWLMSSSWVSDGVFVPAPHHTVPMPRLIAARAYRCATGCTPSGNEMCAQSSAVAPISAQARSKIRMLCCMSSALRG